MLKICEVIRPDFSKIQSYLQASYAAGQLSNRGPCYKLLCDRLAQRFEAESSRPGKLYVAVVASGHLALMAAYAAAGVKQPAVPAYTFSSTVSAATLQGMRPLIVDVDPKTGCVSPRILERIVTGNYDSVVAVAALSVVPDLQALHTFCELFRKPLIIDAAAAFGSKGIFDYGTATCLSFHATKSLPVGECGAVVSRDPNLIKKVEQYANFGFGANKVQEAPGLNGKASEYTCAIALALLDDIDTHIAARKENACFYDEALPYEITPQSAAKPTVYQIYPLRMESFDQAVSIKEGLADLGIETLRYYPPIPTDNPTPTANRLYECNICLPVHSGLDRQDLRDICGVVKKAFRPYH